MLITWEVEGHPHYRSMDASQHIAYISVSKDIGAEGLKPLFIAGSCVTTIFLDLSFASERWLRHTGALAPNIGIAEKVLSGLSIVAAIVGTVGLILLSIFDTLRHPHLHDTFLVLFIVGYVVSAIFICAEYQRLATHHRQSRVLRFSFWLKLAFIIIEVGLAIGFGICHNSNTHRDAAAILEWIIALVFTFYVLTFFVDLLPAVRSKNSTIRSAQNNLGLPSEDPSYPATSDNTANGIADGPTYPPDRTSAYRPYVQQQPQQQMEMDMYRPPTSSEESTYGLTAQQNGRLEQQQEQPTAARNF
ncbi:MAG: hypothetical protein M1819_002271 [Sarea resinae]|nr:MAG: hypothetical protein M1819_002271 [Sarea resinae]